jgi:antitoxin VapB
MALNVKDPEAERLAAEVARRSGESKTGAVRTALRERLERLSERPEGSAGDRLERFLRVEAWPQIPEALLGSTLMKADKEQILGYGPEGT